ncbi:MAG: hypothetical protein AB1632_09585 [Nitrospirota bacterium]
MKKFLAIMLTLIMVLSLALTIGCQKKEEAPKPAEAPAPEQAPAPAPEQAPAPAPEKPAGAPTGGYGAPPAQK